jgi:AMP-dependent synthetase and ligase family protein
MRGYYKNKEATRKAIVDGWLNTGDLGYLDENGYLYILSRADDMIIKSGMNIYPGEVEAQAAELLQIRECVVYKIQANVGQAIAMDVILNPDYKETTKKELMALLATVLPAYQMPSELNIVDALRRNASGKIVRTGRAQ